MTSHATLPQALANLPNAVDVILAIPDTTVYTQQASKALLLFSFRNRIPLIGLTEAWVKAGALYALEWDYEELGRVLRRPRAAHAAVVEVAAAADCRARASRSTCAPPSSCSIKWNMSLLRDVDRSFE